MTARSVILTLMTQKKLNNFIAINVSGLYLAGRQAPSSITERKIYG